MTSLGSMVNRSSVDVEATEGKILPRRTQSLCPECLRVVGATLHEAGGRVFMSKRCPTHGPFREWISSDATFFQLMIQRDMATARKVAGLNLAYLQFDGLSDDVYQKTRGEPLLDLKLAAIENLYAVGIRTVLVPTIAKGVNDDQLGRILRFAIERMRHRPMLMACMHFQDAYNYQLDRVQRCLVHYAAPDGRIYPFCSYNSGPCHRKKVEARFAMPLEQYLAARPAGASR